MDRPPRRGIKIDIFPLGEPRAVISFSLPHADWCRLEKSKAWRKVENKINKLQGKINHK